jgi:hypothetical protein
MKKTLLTLAVFALCAIGRSQEVSLNEVLGPNNTFSDALYDVSFTYPPGWEVLGGSRWGKNNGENTFRFRPVWPSEAHPSVYYQRFSSENPRPANINQWFAESARKKEESRLAGIPDYRNVAQSLVFKKAGTLPSFSYLATYTMAGKPMAEYFVRVAGQQGYVMFFTMGRPEDITAIRAEIDRMAETVRVP